MPKQSLGGSLLGSSEFENVASLQPRSNTPESFKIKTHNIDIIWLSKSQGANCGRLWPLAFLLFCFPFALSIPQKSSSHDIFIQLRAAPSTLECCFCCLRPHQRQGFHAFQRQHIGVILQKHLSSMQPGVDALQCDWWSAASFLNVLNQFLLMPCRNVNSSRCGLRHQSSFSSYDVAEAIAYSSSSSSKCIS